MVPPVVTAGMVFSEVGVGIVLRTQQYEADTPDVLFPLVGNYLIAHSGLENEEQGSHLL